MYCVKCKPILTFVFPSALLACFGIPYFGKELAVSRRCRLKNPLKRCVVRVPLRPRRNPNRIGCQSDAAGEKRTAGDPGEPKTPRKLQGAAFMYICCLNSFLSQTTNLTERIF